MRRNEFRDFCNRLDENMWNRFLTKEDDENPGQKKWSRREKMARADLVIQQKSSEGLTKRQIVTAVVDATNVSRRVACQWVKHWYDHHSPKEDVSPNMDTLSAFSSRMNNTGI
jgi:hypothetical protein